MFSVTTAAVPVVLSLLVLSGCAGPYTAPMDGRTARIRVLSPTVGYYEGLYVSVYPGGKCSAHATFGGLGGLAILQSDKPGLGIPKVLPIERGTSYEQLVGAGEKVLFRTEVSRQTARCIAHASFIPEVNADYEILVHSTPFTCTPEVRRIAVDSTGTAFATRPADVEHPAACE